MDTKHVKNASGQELTVVGFGVVAADGIIEVPTDFHNANFEEVDAPKGAPSKSEQRRRSETESEKD